MIITIKILHASSWEVRIHTLSANPYPLAHTIPDKYGFTLMNQSNLVRQQAAGATHQNTNKMTLTHACMQEDAHKSNQTEAYARARRGKLT